MCLWNGLHNLPLGFTAFKFEEGCSSSKETKVSRWQLFTTGVRRSQRQHSWFSYKKQGFSTLICPLTLPTPADGGLVGEYSQMMKRKLLLWGVDGVLPTGEGFLSPSLAGLPFLFSLPPSFFPSLPSFPLSHPLSLSSPCISFHLSVFILVPGTRKAFQVSSAATLLC